MFIIILIQAVCSLKAENFLCGLRLFYNEQSYFLLDQQSDNSMPYILTSKSPHFALDIQQNYQISQSMNNNSYFLVGFPDAYIFAGNASDIQWLQIQEFKVKQNKTTVDVINYGDYYGYYVDKAEDGGHMLISKENILRDFSYGKTDAVDKYEKLGFIYILSWGGKGDVNLIMKRFIHFLIESEGIEYCQQKTILISLEQIKCNLDYNFEHLTFRAPDLYHPPIHYHLGNQLINGTIEGQYFTRNYPGLQVFVTQQLNDKVLELKIPIKDMETHQQAVESPLSGLIVTVQKENRGFIHILIFESDEGIIINYKEDENLAYITIGMTDSKVFVFSFVTSQFDKFPTIDFIEHVFQDCVSIIQLRNNVCENPIQTCEQLSKNYFDQFHFDLKTEYELKFKSNGEFQQAPYIDILINETSVQNDFSVMLSSTINNREMNHGGFIGSFLRITNHNESINSLIINEQNEQLEAFYILNEHTYTHLVQNIIGQTYVLVFVSKNELSDIECLQLFREFIDHIQRITIIEQMEQRCELTVKNFDIKPIQYKEIHKSVKQPTELIQTQNQQFDEQKDFEYSGDEDIGDEGIEYLQDDQIMQEPIQYVSEASFVPELEIPQQMNDYERMVDMQQDQQFQQQYQDQFNQQQDQFNQQQEQFNQPYQQQQQTKKVEEIRYTDQKQNNQKQQEQIKYTQQQQNKKQQQTQKVQTTTQNNSKKQQIKQQPQQSQKNQKLETTKQNLRKNTQTQQLGNEQFNDSLQEQEEYQTTFHQKEQEDRRDEYYDRGERSRRRSRRDSQYGRNDGEYGRRESEYGRRDGEYGRRDGEYGRREGEYGREQGKRDEYYGSRRRDEYYGRGDDYYDREDYYGEQRRGGSALTGQSIVVPRNPSDQELGKFFREVISKLYIYSDPCDSMSANYDSRQCSPDRQYGSQKIKRSDTKQRDFYRSQYKYDNRYEYRACITVYSKCNFQGESLELCGHQRQIPKQELYLDILSIRADENYIVEFYMKDRNGKSELYTLKGTQKCLRTPLRVDWLLQ